jgi:hypothetical protein
MPNSICFPILGNRYRSEEEQFFFSSLQEDPRLASLVFESEPTNPYDPNAIKVIAVTPDGTRYHLGYVPRNMTIQLHNAFSSSTILDRELIPNSNIVLVTLRLEAEPEADPEEAA